MAESNRIVHLYYINPQAALHEVLAALRKARGVKSVAAEALGTSPPGFAKWLLRFGWRDAVDELVAELKEKGIFPGHKSSGIRQWEVVDRNGKRLGTYSTPEAAEERRAQTRGAITRPRELTPKEQKLAKTKAATARAHNAKKRSAA